VHGEVLVAERTHKLVESSGLLKELRPGQALTLKGFAKPEQSYALLVAA
jgi:class 3 adenylate cyclase